MPPALTAELAGHLDLVALVHHPLCLETGLGVTAAAELERSERAALAVARTVIVTSTSTARSIASMFGLPGERISVAVPGTDAAPLASGSTDGAVRMLAVGTVTPRKGHAILVRALAGLEGRWQLELAGSLERDPATVGELRALIGDCGLADRIRLLGELDEEALAAAYDRADLFVSASFYEGYGMAIAEALARGLPIVAATGGAVHDTVGPDAGLLVPPDDPTALRGALRRFLTDSDLADDMRRGARATRERLPSWSDTAAVGRGHATRGGALSGAFSPDWLQLREPHDRQARSGKLLRSLRRLVRPKAGGADRRPWRRHRRQPAGGRSRLDCAQDWTLVEHDPALIEVGTSRLAESRINWHYRRLDLVTGLERVARRLRT